jgi:hypothetical protein
MRSSPTIYAVINNSIKFKFKTVLQNLPNTACTRHRFAVRGERLDAGESARFTSIFLASSLYCSQAESTPAHPPCFAIPKERGRDADR